MRRGANSLRYRPLSWFGDAVPGGYQLVDLLVGRSNLEGSHPDARLLGHQLDGVVQIDFTRRYQISQLHAQPEFK